MTGALAPLDLFGPLREDLKASALRMPTMLRAGEMRDLLNLNHAQLQHRIEAQDILALRAKGWTYRFPDWQVFHTIPLPGLARVRRALFSQDPWVHWCFFELAHQSLGTTAALALREGRIDEVILAARGFQTDRGVFV